jgi:pyruvate dehydrogenase E2 component (dihydrolipoamide acetyltransferase)
MADVVLPQLGETVTEGTITKWFKKVGDTVKADEPLFEVSTDKVDTEVPSPVDGVLSEIRVAEGDTVDVGTVIAVVGGAGAAPTPQPAPAAAKPAPVAAAKPAPVADIPVVEAAPAPASAAPSPAAVPAGPRIAAVGTRAAAGAAVAAAAVAPKDNRLLSPVVRRLVTENGLDPSSIAGTGPGGRITREDVLDYLDKNGGSVESAPQADVSPAVPVPVPAVSVAPSAPVVRPGERDSSVKLSKIRKLTGDHMIMSKAVAPHAFSVVEVDYANVDRARNAVKAEWKQSEGFSLTYLPFITRAVVDAFSEFPNLNASVSGDDLVVHNFVDLGIAVDLDYQGLLVPVLRDVETKRLRAIAREINDLATRTRTRKLRPDEIQGGTFTLSNNGSAGSVLTMPIINQPQVAILSTDAIVRKPVVVSSADGGEGIAIHPVGNLAMSWDHRAFDGAYAAGFLVAIKRSLETRDWSAEL